MEADLAASQRRVFRQSLYCDSGSWNGRYRANRTGNAYNHIPCLHITLGTWKNATFSLRIASFGFIFLRPTGWNPRHYGLTDPAKRATRLATSRPMGPAFRSRSRTDG